MLLYSVQELCQKSTDPEVLEKCPDIRWHFIGNCQTNKLSMLVKSKNLRMVETVDSLSKADKLQSRCAPKDLSVGVMVQVNTSGEENKNGIVPSDAVALIEHIRDKCPNLKVRFRVLTAVQWITICVCQNCVNAYLLTLVNSDI